jgi:NAD(P)-dependent dehydrogenase (short-subunit alcohol dehydrogenase family)
MAEPSAHPFSLAGKTVLVAGGASGIGASTAAVCAGLGAKLVLADVGDATPVADKLRREGHQASAASCDITDRAAVERLVSKAPSIACARRCPG